MYRIKRNKRYVKMRELSQNGYFELSKGMKSNNILYSLFDCTTYYAYVLAKERDPGLYEIMVGRDRIGRPETMKFSDVLMRCWMQERNPDTGLRKIDDQDALGNYLTFVILYVTYNVIYISYYAVADF